MPEQPRHLANIYEDIVNLQGGGILSRPPTQLVSDYLRPNALVFYGTTGIKCKFVLSALHVVYILQQTAAVFLAVKMLILVLLTCLCYRDSSVVLFTQSYTYILQLFPLTSDVFLLK